MNVFGGAATTKWNTAIWGTDKWGTNSDLILVIGKSITNGCGASSTLTAGPTKLIENTCQTAASMFSQVLQDSRGWYHIFEGGVSEAEDRIDATWTAVTPVDSTWSVVTAIDSTWTEV